MSLSRWKPVHLVGSWIAYWVVLAGVKLGPAMLAIYRVTRPNEHGSVDASFGDGVLGVTVKNGASVVYHGATHLLPLALWIGGPPLALWLLWLALRPRAHDAPPRRDSLGAAGDPRALGEAAPETGARRGARENLREGARRSE